jgi:hypothetical protein
MNKPAKKTVAKKVPAKKIMIGKPSNIDWENMARELQKALRDEIFDGQGKMRTIEGLEFDVRNLKHQVIGYQAVISYLENKLGNPTV